MEKPTQKPRAMFEPDRDSAHYWKALAQGSFEVQHCRDCGHWTWPARMMCSHCHGENLAWEKVKGTGEVYSWIINHRPSLPSIPVPSTTVLVRLDEQPDILIPARLVSGGEAYQGMRVRAIAEPVSDDVGQLSWTAA